MNVTVKYFASMRDRVGRAEEAVSVEKDTMTVKELWEQVSQGEALPENTLIAVNMEYTNGDQALKDGDEIAFFPPVTGG